MDPASQDNVLWTLVISIAALLLCALVFAVAAVIYRILNDRTRRRLLSLEQRWEPLLLEDLSAAKPIEEVYRHVEPADRFFFVQVLHRYMSRIVGQEKERLVALAAPCLPELVRRSFHGTTESRAQAVRLLGAFGFEEYNYRLMEAMDDPSPLVALTAAKALARADYPGLISIVLLGLDRFKDVSVEYLSAMVKSLGPSAAPNLRSIIADPRRPPRIRVVAAAALIQLDDLAAANVAAQVLEHETHEELAATLLRLLARTGLPDHQPVVRNRLADPSEQVRIAAAEALGSLGEQADKPTLLSAMKDVSSWVALQAAQSLRALGGVQELRALAQAGGPRALIALEVLEGGPA